MLDQVDEILVKFKGKEDILFKRLEKKYAAVSIPPLNLGPIQAARAPVNILAVGSSGRSSATSNDTGGQEVIDEEAELRRQITLLENERHGGSNINGNATFHAENDEEAELRRQIALLENERHGGSNINGNATLHEENEEEAELHVDR